MIYRIRHKWLPAPGSVCKRTLLLDMGSWMGQKAGRIPDENLPTCLTTEACRSVSSVAFLSSPSLACFFFNLPADIPSRYKHTRPTPCPLYPGCFF